ncbi:reverse transcriptase family protein [Tautonia rosea]|uniref:reverse transcriptase family protein n=1 Tax=Tautonia rosea TaxID=2728037 RepID=UPI0014764897|nr:reverse transcriptase family protein [Tautonia rosea]
MSRATDLLSLWRAIEQAGGIDAYVNNQLVERGFLVARRDMDTMSDRERTAYKKQLKEEAAHRRELKREAWNAYRARHIVHLGEGIYWNDQATKDPWDAPDAEERAAENELPPLDSPRDLAEALGLTISQLRWLAFHRDAATSLHYRRFTIPKRDGSERAIWAPMPTLKAAQHWILRNIAEKLPVHGAAHGFLAGRSILSNAGNHLNSKLVVKMDVKDFFPSVTFRRVKGIFRRAGYREQVATLLASICTESPREIVEQDKTTYYVALGPRCLPQGAPTSPALTNTLCLRLDRRLDGLARSLGYRYTRYADDLTFSLPRAHEGDTRLGTLLGSARRVVESEGFSVRLEKTRVARPGARQQVTGLVVNGDASPRTPRKLRRQLRAAVHNLQTGRPRADADTPQRLAGLISYLAMTDPTLAQTLRSQWNTTADRPPATEPPA